jgi:hypothetical protein
MTETQDPKLIKILYIIPDRDGDGGLRESLWAHSLGNQLYELQNIPFYVFDLNVSDIVYCDEPLFDLPIIRDLVKSSGNQTLRVVFRDETSDDACIDIMWELNRRSIVSEKVADKRFVFNVPPESDYVWARDFLKLKENEDLLWLYEQSD